MSLTEAVRRISQRSARTATAPSPPLPAAVPPCLALPADVSPKRRRAVGTPEAILRHEFMCPSWSHSVAPPVFNGSSCPFVRCHLRIRRWCHGAVVPLRHRRALSAWKRLCLRHLPFLVLGIATTFPSRPCEPTVSSSPRRRVGSLRTPSVLSLASFPLGCAAQLRATRSLAVGTFRGCGATPLGHDGHCRHFKARTQWRAMRTALRATHRRCGGHGIDAKANTVRTARSGRGAGSTAYSLAAGGSMLHPELAGMIFTPVRP